MAAFALGFGLFSLKNWLAPVSAAALAGLGSGVGAIGIRIVHVRRERAQLMQIFSRCVSPKVAEELWRRRRSLELQGESRVVTAMFTDVRGFTDYATSHTPEQLFAWLNRYLDRMQRVVTEHGGLINEIQGDGLIVIFGAPVGDGEREDAARAIKCAQAMIAKLESLNEDLRREGSPPMKNGIGISTGEAIAGVVGSRSGQIKYTVIGETVNLAARLEAATKNLGVQLLISERTARAVDSVIQCQKVDEIPLKGFPEPVAVYTVPQGQALPLVQPVELTHQR